jgi:hypothetical protein
MAKKSSNVGTPYLDVLLANRLINRRKAPIRMTLSNDKLIILPYSQIYKFEP